MKGQTEERAKPQDWSIGGEAKDHDRVPWTGRSGGPQSHEGANSSGGRNRYTFVPGCLQILTK